MARARRRFLRILAGPGPSPSHLTRFVMYERLRGSIPRVDHVLSVSRSEPLADAIGLRPSKIISADYPEYDLLSLPYDDGVFDAVVSDQVLEHIAGDPGQAIQESLRVVRPGGYIVHTTCFMNPGHEQPHDFWRFSPEALELLCRTAGAEPIQCEGWGNRWAVLAIALGLRTLRVPSSAWNPLRLLATANDPAWPIVTWLVARKPYP